MTPPPAPLTPADVDRQIARGDFFGIEPSVLPSQGTFAYLRNLFAACPDNETVCLVHMNKARHWRTIGQLKVITSWRG